PKPGQQFVEREGLGQVVLCPDFERGHFRRGVDQGRQYDYRLAGQLRDDISQDVEAAAVGEQQVEDDELEGLAERRPEAAAGVDRAGHDVALRLQTPRDEIEDARLIIN